MLLRLLYTFFFISYILAAPSGEVGTALIAIDQVDAKPGFSKEYKFNMVNSKTNKKYGVKQTVSVADDLSVKTSINYGDKTFSKDETNTSESDFAQDVINIVINVKDNSGKAIDTATIEISYNANGLPSSTLKYGKSNGGGNNNGGNGNNNGGNGNNNGGNNNGGNGNSGGNNDSTNGGSSNSGTGTETNSGSTTDPSGTTTGAQATSSTVVIVGNNSNNNASSNTKPSSGHIMKVSVSSMFLILSAAIVL